MRTAEEILSDLLSLRATEGREPVIALYREAEELLSYLVDGASVPVCDCGAEMTTEHSDGLAWECPECC